MRLRIPHPYLGSQSGVGNHAGGRPLRSPDYPKPDSRHVDRIRIKEDVDVRVIHSELPTLLEEAQKRRTFSCRVRYRLEPAGERTRLTIDDEISFLGLARPAPLAVRDVQARWRRSLERLRELAERG